MVDDEAREQYRVAWEYWQQQLDGLHRLLLEGERIPPDQIKGLLGREARGKERYDVARRRLLGLGD